MAFGQATITASVPFTAPAMPPLTGESTYVMPFSASALATVPATPGPVVDTSMTILAVPLMRPPGERATAWTIGGVGRLTNTIGASIATSPADAATRAPRAANGAVASALVSNTTS